MNIFGCIKWDLHVESFVYAVKSISSKWLFQNGKHYESSKRNGLNDSLEIIFNKHLSWMKWVTKIVHKIARRLVN